MVASRVRAGRLDSNPRRRSSTPASETIPESATASTAGRRRQFVPESDLHAQVDHLGPASEEAVGGRVHVQGTDRAAVDFPADPGRRLQQQEFLPGLL